MVSINSSFDAGVLRVCYHGRNRNRSEINKDIFEKCINTIYNCPIVCNYIREEDEIGSHDVEVVKTNKGLKLVNITTPVGVVPTGANYWWEEVEEENGVVHEYLCVEVLIWKRQEAYSKLKENGITDESMEITVKDGEMIDGYYRVYDFEFTAFCLLGTAEPCFESASVRLFEKDEFAAMYSTMMSDLKEEIIKAQPANAVDILHPQNYSEGGNETLDKKLELLAKYNLTVDMLDFNIEDFELDELEQKFEEIKNAAEADAGQDGADNTPNDGEGNGEDNGSDNGVSEKFALAEQFRGELIEALSAVKMVSSWGEEIPKYIYVDYDTELSEVYCYDYEDWKLYGFSYSVNGDAVTIDFACKKRKKFSIVDFDEGDIDLGFAHVYESITIINQSQNKAEFAGEKEELETKYSEATKTIKTLNSEIEMLRKFKEDKLKDERDNAEEAVFSKFEDLSGVEAFEALRENASEYSIEDLEEKCFAIRGRKNSSMSFSAQNKTPKLPVNKHNETEDEPYGGLFIKYGTHK
ncbi:MAG: hypothetical protein ACI4TK_13405 [Agathobacter sp.]